MLNILHKILVLCMHVHCLSLSNLSCNINQPNCCLCRVIEGNNDGGGSPEDFSNWLEEDNPSRLTCDIDAQWDSALFFGLQRNILFRMKEWQVYATLCNLLPKRFRKP